MISIEFIYFFLPVFMGIYALTPSGFRKYICLLGTVLLGIWYAPLGLIPLGVSVFTAYFGGLLLSKYAENKKMTKIILTFCILVNVLIFLFFSRSEYFTNVFAKNISAFKILRVFGGSVFTLHSISYCVDIYTKKYPVEKSFVKIADYVGFFPCLTVGRILNYNEFSKNISSPKLSSDKMVTGIKLFLIGMIQKLVFSVPLYQIWEQLSKSSLSQLTTPAAWIGIVVFSMSFYYEFASYFNMSNGLCSMLGFDIKSNINRPFLSKSLSEFPKRFNSSLYAWQRKYIQKPLLNKLGKQYKSSPLFSWAVYAAGIIAAGLWYGISAQTVAFSVYFMLLCLIEKFACKFFKKGKNILKSMMINILIIMGMPFLGVSGMKNSLKYFSVMFGISDGVGEYSFLYILSSCGILLVLGGLLMSGLGKKLKDKINSHWDNLFAIAMPVFEIIMLIIVSAFISGTSVQYLSFLY